MKEKLVPCLIAGAILCGAVAGLRHALDVAVLAAGSAAARYHAR
ncbi:hypothetical protein [Corynebacterium sp. Marseille-Q2823]|nr:hypothetical protein [Corynebacterium sp. Marseille-Q2823]